MSYLETYKDPLSTNPTTGLLAEADQEIKHLQQALLSANRKLAFDLGATPDSGKKYRRCVAIIDGFNDRGEPSRTEVWVDVYDILNAFEVKDHGYAHAIKKMLNTGTRGHKNAQQDREDILESIVKSNSRYNNFNKQV